MNSSKGLPPQNPPAAQDPADKDSSDKDSSGRVSFDARGNSVWEWKSEETGKYSRDVSTQRLKKLEAPELSLEETARIKKPTGLSLADEPAHGGGFDPYDNAPSKNNTKMPTRGHVAQDRVAPTAARKTTTDLKALSKWMEMKKRLAEQKDDE